MRISLLRLTFVVLGLILANGCFSDQRARKAAYVASLGGQLKYLKVGTDFEAEADFRDSAVTALNFPALARIGELRQQQENKLPLIGV
jgi:hypothetical protein